MKKMILNISLASALAAALFSGCTQEKKSSEPLVTAKIMADALHAVIDSDRTVYTKKIIERLSVKEKLIKASEHWKDENALVLPAQMLRYGSELAQTKAEGTFSYSLLSKWPINKQNEAKTKAEKEGLSFVAKNLGENYYTRETLGSTQYFTAVYADIAISSACIKCHNGHKDSPRDDFKDGEVMGGLVIRIPISE